MELAHPALLAWAAAMGTIPVLLHLLNRFRYRRVRWPAMQFLQETAAKKSRKIRIEHLLLLLLRIAILLLLGAALARPALRSLGTLLPPSAREIVILADASYSMNVKAGGQTPGGRAREFIERAAGALGSSDRISIVSYGDRPRRYLDPTSDKRLAEDASANLPVYPEGGDLPGALNFAAAEILPRLRAGPKEVYVLSDFQRRGLLPPGAPAPGALKGLAEAYKKQGARVALVNVGVGPKDNAGVASVRIERSGLDLREVEVAAEIVNHGSNPVPGFGVHLLVDGRRQASAALDLPPRERASAAFRYRFEADGPHVVSVETDPDPLAEDNRRTVAVFLKSRLNVLAVSGEAGDRPSKGETFYLAKALSPRGARSPFALEARDAEAFTADDLKDRDLVILANAALEPGFPAKPLEAFVAGGGGLWIFAGARVDPAAYNAALHRGGEGLLPFPLKERRRRDRAREGPTALVAEEPDHPAIEYFRDRRDVSLAEARVYEYLDADRAVPPGPFRRVVARFTDGGLALAERRSGKGRVFWFATTADLEWTTMALDPLYPIFLHRGALHLARTSEAQNLRVGEPFVHEAPSEAFSETFFAVDPEGEPHTLAAEVREDGGRVVFSGTARPGAYALRRGSSSETAGLVSWFAVNVDPQEGEIQAVTADEAKKAYPDFSPRVLEGAASGGGGEGAATKTELAPALLWGIFLLLLLESVLARRFGAGPRAPRARQMEPLHG